MKVNFHKSMLVGVHVAYFWFTEVASVMNCKPRIVPFVYICIPIGGNAWRLSFSNPLLDHIKFRLSGWKARNLSFYGRLVLLKSVMFCLLIYFVFFFRAPTCIFFLYRIVLKCFFCGEGFRFFFCSN